MWRTDERAVREQQNRVDELRRQMDFEDEIRALEEYRQMWRDTIDRVQRELDRNITAQLLGENWEHDILNRRTDNIEGFGRSYAEIMRQLDENIDGSVANQIKRHEEMIDSWRNAIDEIERELNRNQDILNEVSRFEASNFAERETMLRDFVNNSVAELQRLQAEHAETKRVLSEMPSISEDVYPSAPRVPGNLAATSQNLTEIASEILKVNPVDLSDVLSIKATMSYLEAASRFNSSLTASRNALPPSQSVSIGDININQPIGDTNALAREINNSLVNRGLQVTIR